MSPTAPKLPREPKPRRVQPENWGELLHFARALLRWAETGDDSQLSMSDAEIRVGMRLLWDKSHDDSKLSKNDAAVAARLRERWARSGRRKFGGTTLTVETIAKCLEAVARGEDAREVFRQVAGNGRPSLGWYHEAAAADYLWARMEGNQRKRALLIAKCSADDRARDFGLDLLSPSSIERFAREYRDSILRMFESDGDPRVAVLRAQLARRSKRGRE